MKKANIHILEDRKPLYIDYGCYVTEYGEAMLFFTEEGVCGLHFLVHSLGSHVALAQKKFPHAIFTHKRSVAKKWGGCIVDGKAPISVLLEGTLFQRKVWKALCDIPTSKMVSYQGLAVQLGIGVRGARAVAGAVAQNFIALLVPCHRVVRKDGHLGGYRWGVEKKRVLLASEGCLVPIK